MNSTTFLRLLPIAPPLIFACGMGIAEAASAPGSGVIPASWAFVAVGWLGLSVLAIVGHHEHRLQKLEQQLGQRNRKDS